MYNFFIVVVVRQVISKCKIYEPQVTPAVPASLTYFTSVSESNEQLCVLRSYVLLKCFMAVKE